MTDLHAAFTVGLEDPFEHVGLITPHNTNDLAYATRGISFAVAGDLKVITLGGDTVTIPNGALVAGVIHAIRATRVYAAGTAATGIVGYW